MALPALTLQHVLHLVKDSNSEHYYCLTQLFLQTAEFGGTPWDSSVNESKLECGPMPNVMATLPNIGGTLCSMLQSLADAHY